MVGDMELLPTGIIPLINEAWVNSFSEVESIKKAIAGRGWFPYNRNLLMRNQLGDTMTMKDIETERKGIGAINFMESTSSIESIHSDVSGSLKENYCLPITQSKSPFNF